MRRLPGLLLVLAGLLLLPGLASAQTGSIAGTVTDDTGGALPGVLVEVTSPALIEKVRSFTTGNDGRYQITNLPIGTYTATFTLDGFQRVRRENIVLTSDFAAPVSVRLPVGNIKTETTVVAEAPTVDVQNARQAVTLQGDDLLLLPTARNINSLLTLTPGITSNMNAGTWTICPGGVGIFCNPSTPGFNQGSEPGGSSLSQGRVLVDGMVINSGATVPLGGLTAGYMADIANAQEVTIQLSGALGESETGGASINIVPRTGGNRYAGNYNTTYTRAAWFGNNLGAYQSASSDFDLSNLVQRQHDVSGAFGGPILRDRLWFYAVVRDQGKKQVPGPSGNEFFQNLHEGQWGYNYQPDRPAGRVLYTNTWRNANVRLTLQASQRNKFNIFWDEQDFCQDPCGGVVSVFTSPESWWSVQNSPNRLQQLGWTNPLTNRILLEANLSISSVHYRTDMHREYENPRQIPRITETGNTIGMDAVRSRVNDFAGNGAFLALTSGSLNSALGGGGAEHRNSDNYRMRATASYVTGTHNVKIGYEGAVYTQVTLNQANDPRMTYNYTQPTLTQCNPFVDPDLDNCGNTHLGNEFVGPQFPGDPLEAANWYRRPRPNTVTINTGRGGLDERVHYSAFYAQDQWTFDRLTLSGALRYDYATSGYGTTCVGPDVFVPAEFAYCTGEHDGVSFHDLSPRWQAVYDVFGTGRTALKFNMGKYLAQAAIGQGVFTNANPARRTANSVTINWNDLDGDRIVDCNIQGMLADARSRHANGIPNPNGVSGGAECASFGFGSDTLRFGRSPFELDEEGNLIGLSTTQCGLTFGVLPEVLEYCDEYGESVIEGWGQRQYQWQLGLGVQHEILPRLSGEVTYNRRMTRNVLVSDNLGIGCNRFGAAATDVRACNEQFLDYTHPDYAFYSFRAPEHPDLPGGGGYLVTGLDTENIDASSGAVVQTFMDERRSLWHGVDTNFVWRAPGGLRLNGGTSTGRSNLNTCFIELDGPDTKGQEGLPYRDGCDSVNPWETRINGSASYTIPFVDLLVSTVFRSMRGEEREANVSGVPKELAIWGTSPNSAFRATLPCAEPELGVGCLDADLEGEDFDVNLLNANQLFGERITLFDLKIAKNIRFGGRRLTIGADIYNLFNSDAILFYNNDYDLEEPNGGDWGQPSNLVDARFVQLSLQFTF